MLILSLVNVTKCVKLVLEHLLVLLNQVSRDLALMR